MLEKITVQVQKITPTQAKLLHAHRSRQAKYAMSCRMVGADKLKQIEVSDRRLIWKTLEISFDAHVRAY
jgi:argininosuccinate lyase